MVETTSFAAEITNNNNATNAAVTTNVTDEENKEEEQSPTMEETFEDPIIPEIKFRSDWTLWEHYENAGGESIDY